jgi:hypothetical protein
MLRISNGILMRAAVVGMFFLTAASAAVIGTLNLGTGGTVTGQLGVLTFNPDPTAIPPGPPCGTIAQPCNAEVSSSTTLSFTGGPLGTGEGVRIFSPFSILTPLPVPDFLTFAAHPNLQFTLNVVSPGSSNVNCATVTMVGESCSVFAGGPLILTLGGNNTTSAAFQISGLASDGSGVASNYIGIFSAPLTELLPDGTLPTPANIQHFFCPTLPCTAADFTSMKSITQPFSAQFTATPIPEPQIPALVLGGLLVLLGRIGIRRFNRSR